MRWFVRGQRRRDRGNKSTAMTWFDFRSAVSWLMPSCFIQGERWWCVFPQNTRERWGKEPDECEEEELEEILVTCNENTSLKWTKCPGDFGPFFRNVSILTPHHPHIIKNICPFLSAVGDPAEFEENWDLRVSLLRLWTQWAGPCEMWHQDVLWAESGGQVPHSQRGEWMVGLVKQGI